MCLAPTGITMNHWVALKLTTVAGHRRMSWKGLPVGPELLGDEGEDEHGPGGEGDSWYRVAAAMPR